MGVLVGNAFVCRWFGRDVAEPEPLPDGHPLWAEPGCFITPHVAGGHSDESKASVRHFVRNLAHFLRGEPLTDRVI